MTDNPNVDVPEPEGAGENQTPVSPDKGKSIEGQPQGSQELLDMRKSFERLERELKGLQSRQDKDKNEVQRFMEDVKARMRDGLSIDEAEKAVLREREADEDKHLLREIYQRLTSSSPSAGNGASVTGEAAKVFEMAGVNANDPNFAPLAAQFSDPIKLAMAIAEKKFSLANRPTPSAADASPMASSPASQDKVDVASLSAEHARLIKNPTANMKRIREIQEELAKAK